MNSGLSTATTTSSVQNFVIPIPSQRVLSRGFRLVNLFSETTLHEPIEKVIKATIAPLYGDQSLVLAEIKGTGSNQPGRLSGLRCEVLLKNEEPVGFIIYRVDLMPFFNRNVYDSLELCHLELMNFRRDAGAGYRSQLYDRIEEIAEERFARSIHANLAYLDRLSRYLLERKFIVDRKVPADTKAGYRTELLYIELPENPTRNNTNGHERDGQESKKREMRNNDYQMPPRVNESERNNGAAFKRVKMTEDEQDAGLTQKADLKIDHPQPTRAAVQLKQITLPRQYIHQIRSGAKTIEGRLNSGQFKRLQIGEQIRFFYTQNPTDDVTCEITALKTYQSFPKMLSEEGYKKCLPEINSFDQACREYDKIPGYTIRSVTEGVLAIHLKVIKSK